MAVADEHEWSCRLAEALDRCGLAEHIVPDRVARAAVEELDSVGSADRLEAAEPGALRLAEHALRPDRRRRRVAAELGHLEHAQHGEVVIAAERQRRPLADAVDALVGRGP